MDICDARLHTFGLILPALSSPSVRFWAISEPFTPNDWMNVDNKRGMEGGRIGLEESMTDTLRLV